MKTESKMTTVSNNRKDRPKGALALVVMMLVSAIVLIVALGMGLSAIAENQITLTQSQGARAFFAVESCMEEALLATSRSSGFGGGVLTVDGVSCEVEVSGAGNERTITVSGAADDSVRKLEAEVELFPFSIVDWRELVE